MDTVETEFLFEVKIDVAAPISTGSSEHGERRIVNITGGRFEGPRLKGEVLPSGADWIWVEPGGRTRLDVRGLLKTDDGAHIYIQYVGRRHGPPEVMARLAAGEDVDPSEYYFRTIMTFETADERYDWLNGLLAVGKGRRPPEGPVYRMYAIR